MKKVKIVTDSTAYLPKDLLKKYNISVVPLFVNYDGKVFPENQTNYHPWFFDRFRNSKEFPTTSQPAAGEFVETFKQLTEDGSSVVSLHISGRLSGTVQSARTATSILGDRDIIVVDSFFTVSALRFFVLEAAKMAIGNRNKDEILEQVEFMKNHTNLFFLVDDLEYLYRGGRIGGAAAVLGTLLQIKPLLYLDDGMINVLAKVRTKEKALARMMNEVEQILQNKDLGKMRVAILHVDNPSGAAYLTQLIRKINPELSMETCFVGPVIGGHVGPGTVGISVTEVIGGCL